MANNPFFFQRGRAFGPASFVIALCLLAGCRGADVPKNDYVKYQLFSPAQSIKVYPADSNAAVQELNFSVEFLEGGKVGKKQYFFNDGTPGVGEVYNYDEKGLLESVYTYDKDGGDSGMYFYTYDGNIILDCKYYGMSSELLYWWHHCNDGVHITATDFYVEGVLQSRSSSVFKDNVRAETVCDTSGTEYLHNEYVYYNLSEQQLLSFHNEDSEFSIQYNDRGLPLSSHGVMADVSGGLYWNDAAPEGLDVLYEYEYDSRGNWILRRQKVGEEVLEILVRDIRY